MKKIILIILISMMTFILGCDFEGDEQRQQISSILERFKNAVNAANENELKNIISEEYNHDDLNKENFI
ncbi:MAG: hypothetical protein KKA19_02400, partial [Candidatus Margulisbacteria bacterium]|nr:hypothetical protein [Candidatus Margulisiibacteriota bacterium]